MNVTARFPEWKHKTVTLSQILETDSGGLIASIGVGSGPLAHRTVESWYIDLNKGIKMATPPDPKHPGNYLNPPISGCCTTIESENDYIVSDDTQISLSGRNFYSETAVCNDPIKAVYSVSKKYFIPQIDLPLWNPIKQVLFITPSARGFKLGGYCIGPGIEGPYTPLRYFKHFAEAQGDAPYRLKDGTFIIQVGFEPTFFLRIDQNLETQFKSNLLLEMDRQDYESLIKQYGLFGAQKAVFSRFH